MSNYSKTTDFEAKDSLPTGDSGKIIRGAEFETEFDAISTAIATKADTAGPTFTGTLTFETISDGTINVTAFVDEDDMSSDSATLVPTQQSVKAYVDSQVTAQDLDFQADTGGALSIDLDSETMTFTGGTGIDTSGSGNAVTFAIDSTVATLTGTQTLTNKTLTSPDVNTPDIDGGTIDGTVIGGTTPAAVSATTVSATGNITVGGTVDGRDVATDGTKLDGIESGATADQTAAEIRTLVESATDSNVFTDADHTKLDGIEAGADVTDTANVTAAGAVMDSELTNETAVKALNQGVATTDSPTFAGATVNGTVTADGLTVDGAVTVNNTASGVVTALSLKNNTAGANNRTAIDLFSASTKYVTLEGGYGASAPVFNLKVGNPPKLVMSADGNGDISFYEDTGTTAKLTWDASAESLNFADNSKAIFGAGSDLQIYHDSSNGTSVITESGGGDLLVKGSNLRLQSPTGDNYFVAINGGASNVYHGGSVKLATTSTGIDVTGTVTADGLTVDGAGEVNGTFTANRLKTDSGTNTLDIYGYLGLNYYQGDGIQRFYGNSGNRLDINGTTGDISFYEDTGTTAKFFWDASDEALRVGSTSAIFTNSVIAGVSALGPTIGGKQTTAAQSAGGFWNSDTGTVNLLNFYAGSGGTQVGSIKGSSTGVSLLGTGGEGLTVYGTAGNVGIGTDSPSETLHISGSNASTFIDADTGTSYPTLKIGGSGTTSFSIDADLAAPTTNGTLIRTQGGAYPLRFGVNTTERMRIDSSGHLLVGTDTFGYAGVDLTVGDTADSQNGIGIQTSTTGYGYVLFGDGTGASAYVGQITYKHDDNFMAFNTAGSERMRIDSSGNLLVGKTVNDNTTAGFKIQSGGFFSAVADGTTTCVLNRLSSDGDIAIFRKDGATVGSIATVSGSLGLNSSGSNISLTASGVGLYADASVFRGYLSDDSTLDLGASNARWKDLYLSGGAYLGGTGSANKLDDYEEGTWTPIVRGSGTNGSYTYSNGLGVYTKVGRQVTLSFYLGDITEVTAGTGYLQIHGCPFTKGSSQFFAGSVTLQSINWNNANSYGLLEFTSSSATSTLYVRLNGDNSSGSDLQISELISGSSDIGGTITFFV